MLDENQREDEDAASLSDVDENSNGSVRALKISSAVDEEALE